MAEVQSALPAAFMQVVGAHKTGPKNGHIAAGQLASFFGVLKSQLSKLDTPEALATQVLPEATIASVLKGEAADKPMLVEKDTDVPLSVSSLEMPAATPAATVQGQESLALSAATTLHTAVAGQAKVSLPQDVEVDAVLAKPAGEVAAVLTKLEQEVAAKEGPEKSIGAVRPEVALKMPRAAIAADSGQALPLTMPATQAAASLQSVESQIEVSPETAAASILLPLGRIQSEPGVSAPLTFSHPFEQSLRQAEAKLNVAIEAPVRSPVFVAELSDKVIWLASRQGQFAEMSLNPPQMGALEVRLSLSGSDASAQFFSANPVIREILDAALPKLRELMAQAGINLGQTEVRDQAFGRRDAPENAEKNPAQNAEIFASQGQIAMVGSGAIGLGGRGLVDLFV